MKILYLKKANDDLVSWCTCGDGRIALPGQLDCPWCGCGWLFSCLTCRKAFTFAEGVEIEADLRDLARQDLAKRWRTEADEEDLDAWVDAMQALLEGVELGKRYVVLDWEVIPADASGVEFEGLHAAHQLPYVPQVQALEDASIREEVLENVDYWTSRALPEEDED